MDAALIEALFERRAFDYAYKMDIREDHLTRLRLAEQQFRLACTVHLAVANGVQTLDVPVEWTFGKHRASYADFGLRQDQADYSASVLETSATYILASVTRDALVALFEDPKSHENKSVVAAYQISRMIRNAFAHSMIRPRWSIDDDCRDKTFSIENVISLDTTNLNGKEFRWQDYGGPLAIFYFGRFVRETLFDDSIDSNRKKPTFPTVECYQQGRLIARRIDKLPDNVIEVARSEADESIDLGSGHKLIGAARAYAPIWKKDDA